MHERLEMLPANKQVGFFSDAYCAEWSYAKAVIVRKVMAKVLAERIELGQFEPPPGGGICTRDPVSDSANAAGDDSACAHQSR